VSNQNAVILATAIAIAMVLSSCDRNGSPLAPLSDQEKSGAGSREASATSTLKQDAYRLRA